MFWLLTGLVLVIIATIALFFTHHHDLAWIVSNLGTVLILAGCALLILRGKASWVSSDKLVNRVVGGRLKRSEKKNN